MRLANLIALVFAATLIAASPMLAINHGVMAQTKTKAAAPEPFLGRANAPVTLIEYGSLTCSHCAAFAQDVFPTLKARFIDTGKVKYIFRTLPTPPHNLAVGLQVVADCAGPRRFDLIEAFFTMQDEILAQAQNPRGALPTIMQIARYSAGLDENDARACLNDPQRAALVNANAQSASRLNISSTPSFIINQKTFSHSIEPNIENLALAIEAELPRAPISSKKAKRR